MTTSSISKPVLYALGNSHVRYLLGGRVKPDEELTQEHDKLIIIGKQLGNTGATIWGLDKSDSVTDAGSKVQSFIDEKLLIHNTFDLLLSFGEVDVRAHVLKHSTGEYCTVVASTSRVVEKYRHFVDLVKKRTRGKILLVGTVPYTRKFMSTGHSSRRVLSYAPQLFNALLWKMCQDEGYVFIDQFECMVDQEGYLSSDYSAAPNSVDDSHLNWEVAQAKLLPQIERIIGV